MYANRVIVVSYVVVPDLVALKTRTATAAAFFAIPNVLDIANPIQTQQCVCMTKYIKQQVYFTCDIRSMSVGIRHRRVVWFNKIGALL